jgi:hypothetical protein
MKIIRGLLISILIVGGIYATHLVVAQTSVSVRHDPVGSQMAPMENGDGFWRGWTVPVDVSQSPTDKATWPTIGLAADSQTIYLAWSDGRGANQDIYYAVTTDGGWNWAAAQPVVTTEASSLRPTLVMSGTMPTVAWAESEAGLDHTIYQWASATGKVEVPNERPVLASAPRLALGSGGELHLALHGGLGTQPDLLYSRRGAGVTTWPTATVVFTATATGSSNPAIALSADGQTVHLVWQENVGAGESEIFYLRGQVSGEDTLWETPLSLSEGITRSVRPAIAVGSGSGISETVHVAWGEQVAGFDTQYVRYSRSDDGGVSWSTSRRVAAEPVSANNVAPTDIAPALAVAPSGAVCVAWHGFLGDVIIEAEEVYLSCSTDQGNSWSALVNVSRSRNIISIRPVLAIASDGILHLAWQELAGDDPKVNYQIYYAQSLPYSVMLPLIRR